jgi:hypothetical protein
MLRISLELEARRMPITLALDSPREVTRAMYTDFRACIAEDGMALWGSF